MLRSMLIAIALAAFSAALAAVGDEWPDGPNKEFFQNLQRPDAWHGSSDFERSCCGPGDVAKTIFKVIPADQGYPQDTWFAWLNESWERIPAAKIVPDFAPDGKAYLFVSHVGNKTDWAAPGYDMVLCFVRPKGGL